MGVSACVLGDKVRYDGGHKKSGFVTNKLGIVFDFVPVCPEVGIGMSVPRPPIHLVELDQQWRLLDVKTHQQDYTQSIADFFAQKRGQIEQLDGYVLAAKSPSCGMERLKVYSEQGEVLHRKGQGLFAGHLASEFPNLPLEEDGRLNDTTLKENFVTKVMAHHAFRTQVRQNPSAKALVAFHSRYKFLVLAYSTSIYRSLGRLVAQAGAADSHLPSLCEQYLSLMMGAMSKVATRKRHTNVLMHIQGFFKRDLNRIDKAELSEVIDKYRLGYVPLLAPVTLIQHHLKRFPNTYLQQQVYLTPYPEEIGLRS